MNRLREKYQNEISKKLMKDLGIDNVMLLPKIQKVCLNAGIGSFRENREAVDCFIEELSSIASQKVYERKARKSEAGFKIRKGEVVGYSVTLRGERMWAFLDKLIGIALPRVRDFRGLKDTAFDKNGNYSLGITEHVIFPEVNPNNTKGIRNMQISVVFNTKDIDKNRKLLEALGMPFKKEEN